MSGQGKSHRVRIEARVERFMTRNVAFVSPRDTLVEAQRVLDEHKISCVLVRDAGRPIGVVSRTDLLRAARREAVGHGGVLAPLPNIAIGPLCERPPITVDVRSSVSDAAALMLKERVHRVFVERAGAMAGVFSTRDLLDAVMAARVMTRVSDVMSHPVFTIAADASIAQATDRLAQAHVSGLTVVDPEGWPVGYYAQAEALAARQRSSDAPVEDVMNHALVCLHDKAELHRAAALARSSRARRVLIVASRDAVGVITPLDFARAVGG